MAVVGAGGGDYADAALRGGVGGGTH
jgi:hypothetical protein